jgi:hypothetical protein
MSLLPEDEALIQRILRKIEPQINGAALEESDDSDTHRDQLRADHAAQSLFCTSDLAKFLGIDETTLEEAVDDLALARAVFAEVAPDEIGPLDVEFDDLLA